VADIIVSLVHEEFDIGADDAQEVGWQDRALCAQTDPEAFFPEKGAPRGRRSGCAVAATSGRSASSTRWSTTSGSASGAACRSASGVGSSGRRSRGNRSAGGNLAGRSRPASAVVRPVPARQPPRSRGGPAVAAGQAWRLPIGVGLVRVLFTGTLPGQDRACTRRACQRNLEAASGPPCRRTIRIRSMW